MRLLKRIFLVILSAALCACSASFAQEKISIVCTSFPCYDFARAVAGESAQVRLLIKPGAEVHSYEPTPADVLAIADCDLFVYVGGESDTWVEDILDTFGEDGPRQLRFFDCVEALEEAEHEGEHDHAAEYDEHIWTSPKNAVRMVKAMQDELCAIMPGMSEKLQANAQAYIDQIEEIDAAFERVVESGKRREMIFADRFPFLYFAKEYDIEWYAAFDSCSSESEPSAKTMMELLNRILEDDIPVVYTIELSNEKTAKAIADETGVEICTFYSVQNVTEADFSAGESYVSLMLKNVAALERGLN